MPSHFQINIVCLTYSLPEYFEKLTLKNKQTRKQIQRVHWGKSVQIRSYFWFVFSFIWTDLQIFPVNLQIQSEYRKIRTRNNSAFGCFLRSGHITKTRTNLKSKMNFSESWFNFLQNSVVFPLVPFFYTAGVSDNFNPQCCCHRLATLKEFIHHYSIILFDRQFLLKFSDMLKVSGKCKIFSLVLRQLEISLVILVFVSRISFMQPASSIL